MYAIKSISLKYTFLVLGLCGILTGCSSILTDSTQRINVTTNQNKTFQATVDGQQFTVPGTVLVKKDGDDKIVVTNEPGCASTTAVPKKIEGIFWLNILSGGTTGSATDSGTGKMWTYDQTVVVSCFDQ